MGRTEKSQGLAPPAIRKDIRAKQARHIVNKVVPAVLASNARARRGADGSELIADPKPLSIDGTCNSEGSVVQSSEEVQYITRKGQGRRKVKGSGNIDDEIVVREGHGSGSRGKGKSKKRSDSLDEKISMISLDYAPPASPNENLIIRIVATDTLTAAHMLTFPTHYNTATTTPTKPSKAHNVCILNMASPLRPGGGVLSGATSQEEFLCARTTLLPSLQENFYRLPELGGIWTSDVLVFRSALPLGDSSGELGVAERYWIDVVSAGMLRFPELEGEEDEEKKLGKKDREMVEAKMRAVLRIAVRKGAKKLVLGAWGCGAYGNPVADVAQAWKKVLVGSSHAGGKKGKTPAVDREAWRGVEEVVFAINNRKMANEFALAFGRNIEVETGPGHIVDDDEEDEEDSVATELRSKIQEMESQLSKVWNPDLKARMGVILGGLKAQLRAREDEPEDDSDDTTEQHNKSKGDDEVSVESGQAVRLYTAEDDGSELSEDEEEEEDDDDDDGHSFKPQGGVGVGS
ncbi:hypothetical protein BKA66DRAFT_429496 [Pyrenochaeta sp. MPI-SDFR-AT-0127]|nr:hypothetical protein BKA66DRAFT_429496 [Pyrenochaeta sp. MPI-SDFR-AT-0127]